jgi:hypothetical protein
MKRRLRPWRTFLHHIQVRGLNEARRFQAQGVNCTELVQPHLAEVDHAERQALLPPLGVGDLARLLLLPLLRQVLGLAAQVDPVKAKSLQPYLITF